LSKLASNAMLAQRISSINSLSVLCEKTEANIEEVSIAIGMDHRIGPKFLNASVGFGGSCFKKDILNLVYLCRHYGLDEVAEYWHQVIKINDYQTKRFAKKIIEAIHEKNKKSKVTLLGWSFKKDTNDSRESASIYIADMLINEGENISIYDPMVKKERIQYDLKKLWESKGLSKKRINNNFKRVSISRDHLSAIKDSSIIAILTEWDEFKSYNWKRIIKKAKIFDGRNLLKNYSTYSIGKV